MLAAAHLFLRICEPYGFLRSPVQHLNAPIISASLCFPFDMALLLVAQNHIDFPADCGLRLLGQRFLVFYLPT